VGIDAAAEHKRLEAWRLEALRLDRCGRADEALVQGRHLLTDARGMGDPELECRAAADIAWYCFQLGDPDQGLRHAQQAIEIARSRGDRALEARGLSLTACMLNELGRSEEAIDPAMHALRLAEAAGDPEALSFALGVVGTFFLFLQQPERALDYGRRAAAVARQAGDPVMLARRLINVGEAHAGVAEGARKNGETDRFKEAMAAAVEAGAEARNLAEAAGDLWAQRLALGNLAEYHITLQDYAAAKRMLDIHAGLVGGDYRRDREHYLYTLGRALLGLGDCAGAIECFDEAIAIAAHSGNVETQIVSNRYLSEACERSGDFARALVAYRRYHEACTRQSAERAQREARLAEVRYETEKLRAQAESEARRAQELASASEKLREARIAAEQASRAKSSFLAAMSHELRTPLNAILGFSEAMQHGIFGPIQPDGYREYVDIIHKSADHLRSLISDLLDLSRIEAGKLELSVSELVVDDISAEIARMMAPMAQQRGVTLSFPKSADAARVLQADARATMQIMINLITNAIKFTPRNGNVSVHFRAIAWDALATGRSPAGVLLEVSDNGVGLTEDEIATALQPYGRIRNNAETASAEGTGLGLPLVKGLAELHGGELRLQSRKGVGTTAAVFFPARTTQ
jgi:signal transduction histidine kinase